MIVTFTPNPSIDSTLELSTPLHSGQVQRAAAVTQVAGGKGINVAHAVHLAGRKTLAIYPSSIFDPFEALIRDIELPAHAVDSETPVRVNTTITDPTGTTTKINGPGPMLGAQTIGKLTQQLAIAARKARWVVFAGSLPGGVPTDWYTQLTAEVRKAAPQARIAVDTSDAPLISLGKNLDTAAPDLIKPNSMELGQLTGTDGASLEKSALAGDFSGVIGAARRLIRRGIPQVLVTLGPAGAVLVLADAALAATPPPITVASTVGAGDCSLAGYILARRAGGSNAQAIANAVAYGTAATALPGTTIPTPEHLDLAHVSITELS